ncbi:hypothetical protein [Spiroplasma endosymbiont of Crioceris asparagi]|uniref:hypothetical protein n=1 Tax=Spiroplasma endosymbiont of Crioceris asparagi TaxID=3066286 RepID=UPI0030CD8CFF
MKNEKKYLSILEYKNVTRPAVIEDFVEDIKITFEAISTNLNIMTYFNMICFDLYGFEFDKMKKTHGIQLQDEDEDELNLTYLEVLYNLIAQIHIRKLKYTDQVGYDLYILPLKIKKYLNSKGYNLITSENARGVKCFKLELIEE